MDICLVGGAGYVGSVLARELLLRGYSVKIIDRLYYTDIGIREIKERVNLVTGDIRTLEPATLKGADCVINLSGLSNDPTSNYNEAANKSMNTDASIRLAEMCKKIGIKKYILASSASIYDVGSCNEEEDIVLDENSPVAPKAAYSSSKYNAEIGISKLADKDFNPIFLRKGTIFGFSPRMRYDLVVNTFIKSALSEGHLTTFYGGRMWRPLVEVRDVARAYIAAIQAEDISNEVINITNQNYRISELGLEVREALRNKGVKCDIKCDFAYKGVRNYRISNKKAFELLKWKPEIGVSESVSYIYDKILEYNYTDWHNPIYYNIKWMQLLEEAKKIINITGDVF